MLSSNYTQLLKFSFVFLLWIGQLVSAQNEIPSSTRVLKSGDVLITKSRYPSDHLRNITDLWLLDPITGYQSLFLNIEREGYRIRDLAITSGGKYLFTLEIQGRMDTGFVPLGKSELVRQNLETGEREVLLTGTNFTDFRLSIDAKNVLIQFYPKDMTFVDRYDVVPRKQWCVAKLDVTSNHCNQISFPGETYPQSFEWVTNDLIAFTLNFPTAIYLLSTETMTTEEVELPEGINAGIIAKRPNSDTLLIFDNLDDTKKLLSLNITQHTVIPIAEFALSTTHIFEVSPDGKNVVIGVFGGSVLVNLENGQIIQSYSTFYGMEWGELSWIPGRDPLLIGQMSHRGVWVLTVVLHPVAGSPMNIFPPPGRIIVVL